MTGRMPRMLARTSAGDSGRRTTLQRVILALTAALVILAGAIISNGLNGKNGPDYAPLSIIQAYAARPGGAVSIFVSPRGNDDNPGTFSRPFRTLPRAQQVVRALVPKMLGQITVYLEAGTYRLAQTLSLDARDSGRHGDSVVWRAFPGAYVVISGARRIWGWKLTDPSRDIWSASVPSDLNTRQVYVNGTRATLPMAPLPVHLYRTRDGYRASSPVMAHWRNPSQIEFVYTAQLGQMSEPICPIASINGDYITMAQPCWDNSTRRLTNNVSYGSLHLPTYVENAYEQLSEPGQFYLDQRTHVLSYIPRHGQNMHTADVEAPALQTLIAGHGSARIPIHNITFFHLQFSYGTWLQPSTSAGFSEVQSGYTITGYHGYKTEGLCQYAPHGTCPYGAWTKQPGNLQFSYDRNIAFVDDRFVHLGASGLNLDDGSRHATVIGSVFTDISGNGIEVGSVDMPNAKRPYQTNRVRVIDNHLYGMPDEYPGEVPILVGYAANTTIAHNQIDHVSYSGISMGWGGWQDKIGYPPVPNFSHHNVVAGNLIYDYMQTVSDGAGIYTQGIEGSSMADGEKVTNNVIYDQLDWSCALHSDNGATYVTYANNVLYNDDYDFCSQHNDYRGHPRALAPKAWDPQVLRGNFWQEGDRPLHRRKVIEANNRIITGPAGAPASITARAGIQKPYRFILGWHLGPRTFPNSPTHVAVLYAFRGKAYITWHPAIARGTHKVVSYTVSACEATGTVRPMSCTHPASAPVTISVRRYDQIGYAIVPGLLNTTRYVFTVVANTSIGSSTPALPSAITRVSSRQPARPGKPARILIAPGRSAVTMLWYPPKSGGCTGPWWMGSCTRPVLSYIVTNLTTGQTYDSSGLGQLFVSNGGGRVLHVFGGLVPGVTYTFSVAAVTPGGVGPALVSPPVTLSG
jgi:Right handed beta helix region